MKVLITGADGQLGRELQRICPDGWLTTALSRTGLDIINESEVKYAVKTLRPDIVINTAAFTEVDKAETEPEIAAAVNASGAANIASAVATFSGRLIHISTNYVFDGKLSRPYLPSDLAKPINYYGKSKLQGEQAVLHSAGDNSVIIRSSWIYSSHGTNFVKAMIHLMGEKNEIDVVSDQVGTPTWARDLAQAIWHIAKRKNICGIYHWTNAGVASWYDFAVAIQEEAVKQGILQEFANINPVRSEDFPALAKRPHYTVLDNTLLWGILGYTASHWRESLRIMLWELKELGNA